MPFVVATTRNLSATARRLADRAGRWRGCYELPADQQEGPRVAHALEKTGETALRPAQKYWREERERDVLCHTQSRARGLYDAAAGRVGQVGIEAEADSLRIQPGIGQNGFAGLDARDFVEKPTTTSGTQPIIAYAWLLRDYSASRTL